MRFIKLIDLVLRTYQPTNYLRRPPDLDPLFLRGANVDAGVVGAAPNAGATKEKCLGEYQVVVNINIDIMVIIHTLLPAAG